MVRGLLVRGMLCGLVAGLLGAVVAKLLGEGAVGKAIFFEEQRTKALGEAPDPEVFSRTVQNTVGLLTGMVAFGVAVGGLYALAYAIAQGRLGHARARTTAAIVAAAAFAGLYLIPVMKYPANPPSVGNPDTIGHRTALYFTMMVISVVVVVSAIVATRQLTPRLGAWNAAIASVVAGVVVLAIVYEVLPGVHEVPQGFPAETLWKFRIASIAIQLTVWATIGLTFGALTERSLREPAGRTRDRAAVDV
jgi:hypothetical protein